MSAQRQLAAIMFTDIEGYTAVMQQDEQQAIDMRQRHRQILEAEHQRWNGRIMQYYGDGTLSMFQSAVEAVQCAQSMQTAFQQPPVVPVRIGIHLGDVIIDDELVFGDGVNLASRIESLGVPGSVLISDRVNDEIRNHPELRSVSLGGYQLKNIRRKVEVFALEGPGLVVPDMAGPNGKIEKNGKETVLASVAASRPAGRTIPEKSIAILPFVNLSKDPDQDYFGEGVAEEILSALSNLKDLKVAGRASSFQFTGKNLDTRQIGDMLGVRKLLEGSVRRQGNQLRVTVQLINAEDGFHIWSERYDRKLDDIFAIQEEIALAVAEKLKVLLIGRERESLTKSRTQNTGAYELYLKGRYYTNQRGLAVLKGIECFQQAIDLDPSFALALAGFADANLIAAFYGILPARQVVYKAREAAEKAIRINPALCEPYCSLGCYYTLFEWNWLEAEKNFRECIELNPQYPQGHYWYGLMFLAWVKGDFVQAEEHGRIAIRLDPLSSLCYSNFGSILHAAGKYHEALAACKSSIELDPQLFTAHIYEGWSWLALHQYEKAIDAFEKGNEFSRGHHLAQNSLIIAYATVWRFEKARTLLEELKKRSATEYIGAAVTGLSAAYLEDLDEAFDFLDTALEERDPMLLTFKHEHWVPDNLRIDPRFQKLMQRISFPEIRKPVY